MGEPLIRYILSAIIFFLASAASANPDILIGGDDRVAGFLQSTYVNMWWQWAASMPSSESPVRDTVGIHCGVNQAGPVWFLAGGYGSSKIHRTCDIPSDKYIFFPVINMVYFPQNEYSKRTCDSVKKEAALNNHYLTAFKVLIDDHKFVNPAFYRQASDKCFDLAARAPGVDKYPRAYPAATDGYWIMLKPLSVGKHHIAFRAEYTNPSEDYGLMIQDIVYDINIYKP